jgi:AraC family transcriptional regulator, arabinose operon regulatory protein
MKITPAPAPVPIIAGLQSQGREFARGFRPGGTKDWLLVATLAGQGFVRVLGQQHILHPGDLLLFAPDTPQDYGYLADDSAWLNIWVHVRPRAHWAPWLLWPALGKGIMVLPASTDFVQVEAALRDMLRAMHQPARLRHDLAMNALERALILCDAMNPLQERLDPRIARALAIIGEQLASPLSLDRLSTAVGLSRSRFAVLFRGQTAQSPQRYIEAMRLDRAAQLLTVTGWPIGQIARAVGFDDPYYFSTRFRARWRLPPKQYRAQIASSAV